MTDLTFTTRITEASEKATKLVNAIHKLKTNSDMQVEVLEEMVFGILRDEIELISLIESKEVRNQTGVIQLPIMNQKKRA